MQDPVKVSKLDGKELHYDRFRLEDYGLPGHPHSVRMERSMRTICEACFKDIFKTAPSSFGKGKYILTAGAYVNKPGWHGKGRAFDLDGLIWEDQNWVADAFPRDPQLYLAVESVVRQHFGTVLTWSYNDPHKDHIHMDNGTNPGFKKHAKSHVIYLQNAIFYNYGIDIARDGAWGPETDQAQKIVREELGIGGFSDKENWMKFLNITAKNAFGIVENRNSYS